MSFSVGAPGFSIVSFSGNLVGQIGSGSTKNRNLTVPFQPAQDKTDDVLSLITWRTRISEFKGRDGQLRQLQEWAESDQPISLKFVTGEGGVGKTRLAAEFAASLGGWSAGFVDLGEDRSFMMKRKGTLLIVDYPEEHRQRVAEFLSKLSTIAQAPKLRVLFLTRSSRETWQPVIDEANASHLIAPRSMALSGLDDESAYGLFGSAQQAIQKNQGKEARPVSYEEFTRWLSRVPEHHDKALFVLALAAESVLNPDREVVTYTGRDVMDALVRREVVRLGRIGKELGFEVQDGLARLVAMAAIAGQLPLSRVKELRDNEAIELGIPAGEFESGLSAAGLVAGRAIPAPKPDILAAALVTSVFSERPEEAPELLWATLEDDLAGGLNRLGRLSHDSEFVLGMRGPGLGQWLAQAVNGDASRCSALRLFVGQADIPHGWLKAAIVVCQTLLGGVQDGAEKARLHGTLSNHLSDVGDTVGALEAIQRAVEICRAPGRGWSGALGPAQQQHLHADQGAEVVLAGPEVGFDPDQSQESVEPESQQDGRQAERSLQTGPHVVQEQGEIAEQVAAPVAQVAGRHGPVLGALCEIQR